MIIARTKGGDQNEKPEENYKIHNKKRKSEEAPLCPYCGRRSVLRPAEYVYGEDTIDRESMLYVCSGYPSCEAYVGVHEGTRKAKGMLANSELRNKRIRAHRALNEVVRTGLMSKDGVYIWLSSRLNIPYKQTHIGYFSDYLCDQTIIECEGIFSELQNRDWEKSSISEEAMDYEVGAIRRIYVPKNG